MAYGSTEIGRGAVLADADLYVKPLSVGLPPPAVEARIDADDELLQRGPTMFSGYLDRPDATADARSTPTAGTTPATSPPCDADGYLTITGRRSEGIRSGGEWIAPVEVEAAVLTHPAVAEVGVVGLPDPRWGELVCAAIVARPGATVPTVEELRAHVASRLVAAEASARRRRRRAAPPHRRHRPDPPRRTARRDPRRRRAMSPGSRTSDSHERVIGGAAGRAVAERAAGADAGRGRAPTARGPGAGRARRAPRGAQPLGRTARHRRRRRAERRPLVITWVNRGTLHLIGAEDYWWLHPLTTPQLATGNRRRLRQEGVSERQAERGVDVVAEAVIARATDARRAPGAARRRRRAHRRPSARARAPGGNAPRPRGPRPDARLGARFRRRRRLARRRAGTARAAPTRWRAWPVGTSPVTAPPTRPTSHAGRGSRSATPGSAFGGIEDEVSRTARRARRPRRPCDAARLPGPRLLGPFDPLLLGWVSHAAVRRHPPGHRQRRTDCSGPARS